MKPTIEQQIAALERSHRRVLSAVGVIFAAALAVVVVGAPVVMAGSGLSSSGAIVNGAAISPSTISVTGDITLGNASSSAVRGGSGLLRLDDSIGSRLFYTGSTFTLDGNASLTNTAGTFTVTGDTTSPARPGFALTPQDAQPSGANAVGDLYVTTAGLLKICTVAGTPGTWVSVGAQ